MSKNTGGPAFPVIPPLSGDVSASGYPYPDEGMTLRDYFAIHARHEDLHPVVSGRATLQEAADYIGMSPQDYNGEVDWQKVVAKARYEFANAMLAEREKE